MTVEEEYPENLFEVSVTICNDEYIHKLNKEYRGKDKATDVLSFPMFDENDPDANAYILLGELDRYTGIASREKKKVFIRDLL